MSELEIHNPFELPSEDLGPEYRRPTWWFAHQLRIAGASWAHIAHVLGYKDENSAEASVHKNKFKTDRNIENIVDIELDRLDLMQLICWRNLQAGDTKEINNIIKIQERRAKYLGLDVKADAEAVVNNTAIFIGGTETEYKAALKRARDAIDI